MMMEEQSFQQGLSGNDADRIGQMKACGFLLLVEVDGFQDRVVIKTYGTGRTAGVRNLYLSAQVRIVDAE